MKITKKNIIIGIAIIVLLWGLSAVFISLIYGNSDRGTFGDMFGAINALFSGLALFGIIISILIQQNELNLQRQELADTRKEFVTNRVTTILFKQLDYLNSSIDKQLFYPYAPYDFGKPKDINDFVAYLQELRDSDRILGVRVLIEKNSNTIASLSTKIVSVLNNFSDFLNSNDFDLDETLQMKKLFKSNLHPAITNLLLDKLSILKSQLKVKTDEDNDSNLDIEIKKLEKAVLKIEFENIKTIFEYDKQKS
jgi:hypothetical protein